MKNRNFIITLLLISLLGFSISIHTKYTKSYLPGISKLEITNKNKISSEQLNLGENIAFLEKTEETKRSFGIGKVKGDENAKALRRLKTINLFCILGMVIFPLLFIWSILKLKKLQKHTSIK